MSLAYLLRCTLQIIPEHVYKNEELVKFLDELIVTNGYVKKMQPYIDLCENLTKLVIHDNLLKKFPPAFTELEKLKYLDFGGNQIKKYPGEEDLTYTQPFDTYVRALIPPPSTLFITYLV